MDALYFAVKKEHVYEVNVPKRWYNDITKYNPETFVAKNPDYLNTEGEQPT